jgi:hypothetical protein
MYLDPSGLDDCPPSQNARGGVFKANDITVCTTNADGSITVTLYTTGTVLYDQFGNAYVVTDAGTLDGASDSVNVNGCQASDGCYTSLVVVTTDTPTGKVGGGKGTNCGGKAAANFARNASLDALSAIPIAGVAGDIVTLAGAANTSYNLASSGAFDGTGSGLSFSQQLIQIAKKPGNIQSIERFSARAAEAIPVLGAGIAAIQVGWDGYQAYQDYQNCEAGG